MSKYSFASFAKPEDDPMYESYKEYLYSLLDILEPTLISILPEPGVEDDDSALEEVNSLLACFASYIYKVGFNDGVKMN